MPAINDYIIETKDLEIGYRRAKVNFPLLPPINIGVRKGELTGLIGRNGAGKSTLLRTVAGLQSRLMGSILLLGHEINNYRISDLARVISFVSTENVRIQNLKVRELVALGRFPHTNWIGKLAKADMDIINEALELTGLANMRDRDIYNLSDGERQKAMIARALAQDTPLIILDEPTAFLDLPSRYEIVHLLRKLSTDNKRTIVFSTHDLQMAMNESDCLWIMTSEGIFQGAPEDLLFNKVFHKLFLNSCIKFVSFQESVIT